MIGFWGQRHKQYLKEHKQFIYNTMLIEGTLNRYLADINQQAEQMFHRSIEEMAQKQGVTEQLKADQPMEWIGLMNNIQACAREIVNNEIIFATLTIKLGKMCLTRKLGVSIIKM